MSLLYDDDGFVRVYVDGCCFNNGYSNATAGVGVFFNDGHSHNVSAPVRPGSASNNEAEIQAMTTAFRRAQSLKIPRMRIYTDSQFAINCLKHWLEGWKANGMRRPNGMLVQNRDSLLECDNARRTWGGEVDYEHVVGHSGHYGNEQADRLAKQGASRY